MLEPSLGKTLPHVVALTVNAWALCAWSSGWMAGVLRLPVVGPLSLSQWCRVTRCSLHVLTGLRECQGHPRGSPFVVFLEDARVPHLFLVFLAVMWG